MEESHIPEDRIILALIERVLSDRESGVERTVEEYQRMFPGHEEVIAREFEAATLTESKRATLDEALPEQIGTYRVLQILGEGGMGTVYIAQQREPMRRRVALKVIKLGLDSDQVLRRFEAERQALAMMEHTNIAKVFDAGTTDRGQPYFAMEYVKGKSLTEFCDQNRLSVEKRLSLFRQVCAGVQHAHQKGVIHRDIKPGNVLVTDQDGQPTIKIIDFGIARATDHRLIEATLFTEQGQVIGTPEYMSPEQADLDSQDIDTRSDVYALGVLLYELLVGQLPFSAVELRQAGLMEMQRKIREDDPPRPSTRLTSAGSETELAQLRATSASTLVRRIQGDLDWIVMKALEKNRDRRYQNTSAMAEDIERHLANEPVLARAPSARDRLGKFVRRNPTKSVAIGLGVVAAVVVTALLFVTLASLTRTRAVSLANANELVRSSNPMTALLLALDAVQVEKIAESWSSLYSALASVQELAEERFNGQVDDVAFSSDGKQLLVRSLRDPTRNKPASVRLYEITRNHHRAQLRELRRTLPTQNVGAASFLPDDRVLVIYPNPGVSSRQRAEIWNRKGKNDGEFAVPGARVRRVAASSDGKRIAIVQAWEDEREMSGKRVVLFDVDGTRLGAPLPVRRAGMLSLRFSPDGSRIAVGVAGLAFPNESPRESGVILWEPDKGTSTERTWTGDIAWPLGLDFAPDGRHILVTARKPNITRIYEVPFNSTKNKPWRQVVLPGESARGSRFHPSNRFFITGGTDKLVKIWNLEGRVCAELPHGATAMLAAISADGSRLLTRSQDESARLWSFEQDASSPGGVRVTQLAELRGHSMLVRTAALSPDGSLIATGGNDHTLRLWDATPRAVPVLHHPPELFWASFQPRKSPAAGLLLTAGADGTVRVWDRDGRPTRVVLSKHDDRVNFAGFSHEGNRVVTAGSDGTARVWNLADGSEVCRLVLGTRYGKEDKPVPGDPLSVRRSTEFYTARFSPDGRLVVGASPMGAFVWRIVESTSEESNEVDCIAQVPTHSSSASFSPDGTKIVVASLDGFARVLAFADSGRDGPLTAELELEHAGSVTDARFSPDGKRIATSCGKEAFIWSSKGEHLARLSGHQGEIRSVSFSQGGRRIVTASKDGTARIWDLNGHELVVLRGHVSFVTNAEFSEDDKQLLTASQDGTVRLWPADFAAAKKLAHERAFRGFTDGEREQYSDLIVEGTRDGK
jgi:eukaryotic-like serine/threonine-protein kinase